MLPPEVEMLVGLALLGCQETPAIVLGPAEFLDGTAVESVRAEGSIGPAPHAGIVRAVNAWGAAVAAPSATLTVNGQATTVAFDGLGYGTIVLTDPGVAHVEGAHAPATVAASSGPALAGFFPGSEGLGDALTAGSATRGVAVASGSSVWWVDATNRYPVLTFPDGAAVQGLQTGNLDTDGIVDAIAWSADTLVFLRGRNGGGLAWGAALKADESVVAATMGDADNDGHADVAVIWGGASGGELEMLWGGSGWDFERSETTRTEAAPIAIGIGDNAGSGQSQVTITRPDGWERFLLRERRVTVTGPNFSDLAFAAEGGISSSADINGDGGAEIITWGAYRADQTRDLFVVDLVDDTPTTLNIQVGGGRFTFGDTTGDGQADALLQFADRELVQLYADPESYHQTRVGKLGQTGEMAISDLDGDTIPELFVSGVVGEWWQGTRAEGDYGPVWTPAQHAGRRVIAQLTGPVLSVDDDGDPSNADFLGFAQEGTATMLHSFRVGVGPLWKVVLTPALEPGLDLAVCGDYAYALTPSVLFKVSLNNHNVPASIPIVGGSRLDCGVGPNGAVVAVLVGDVVWMYNEGLGFVGNEDHVGARDVALYEEDGPTVATCATDGCSVVRWERPEGDVLAESDGLTTTIHLPGGDLVGAVGGALGVGDADGDGVTDLTVITSEVDVESRVGLWRGFENGVGPVEIYHTPVTGVGPLLFADANADGAPDAWIQQGADLFIPGF